MFERMSSSSVGQSIDVAFGDRRYVRDRWTHPRKLQVLAVTGNTPHRRISLSDPVGVHNGSGKGIADRGLLARANQSAGLPMKSRLARPPPVEILHRGTGRLPFHPAYQAVLLSGPRDSGSATEVAAY